MAKKPKTGKCVCCGRSFKIWPRSFGKSCCSARCGVQRRIEGHGDIPERPCAICGLLFKPRVKNAKYCGTDCRDTATKSALEPKHEIRGVYVYMWFKLGSQLPYYVGKGVGDRAWRNDSCEKRVEIIRDNLTDEGARLVEASLISALKLCGVDLDNIQLNPLQRQEILPLENTSR